MSFLRFSVSPWELRTPGNKDTVKLEAWWKCGSVLTVVFSHLTKNACEIRMWSQPSGGKTWCFLYSFSAAVKLSDEPLADPAISPGAATRFAINPWTGARCMLKDRNSIYKTVQGEELDKHQLILCAGKDTGKVLKMAIRVKKLEVVGLVIINAPDHCSRPLFLLLGRDTHLNFNTKAGCYPRK